ncbi:uncharacterized membrane protein YebE (DUF533 family) [Ancylobacter sp. 3268]|uniref:tellurite resistance TerB family protein n=1 Tax=Ancylobacter sp. 3268 TaxID=2817752 RepID=UPI00285CA0EB|nr:DUF533 domain-containing protein [Ancylobacter sp. 3268]MDR6952122.1 uncharacterized membrane protein YebE (DUF533 family) [Ancylobacter sp. 3268]
MFDPRTFDAKRLLDQFLSPQQPAGGQVPARPAQAGGSPLDGILGQLGSLAGGFGGGQPARSPNGFGGTQPPGARPSHAQPSHAQPSNAQPAGAQPSGAGDLMGRAKDYLGNNGGSLASGAAAGALVSLVLGSKSGRKMAGNAVALGGLALVGTLAYKAYTNYRNGEAPQQTTADVTRNPVPTPAQLPPPNSPFNPSQTSDSQLPLTLLRTMIAASLADGHIDDAERVAIAGKLNESGVADLGEAERFLSDELANPATVETIARAVASEEEAAEVYMAALLAIDPDSTSERAFLARLAMALRLDPALTPHLESAARAARQG